MFLKIVLIKTATKEHFDRNKHLLLKKNTLIIWCLVS